MTNERRAELMRAMQGESDDQALLFIVGWGAPEITCGEMRALLTSTSAPSGWQQRIAAMPPGAAYVHVEIRDETSAVLDSFNVDAREVGQNAKDALPPSFSDWQQRITELVEASLTKGVQFGLVEAQQLGALAARQWIVETAAAIVEDALPRVPEGSSAKHGDIEYGPESDSWEDYLSRKGGDDVIEVDEDGVVHLPAEADASPVKETPHE